MGLGHNLKGIAGRYTDLTDEQFKEAYRKMLTSCLQEKSATAAKPASHWKDSFNHGGVALLDSYRELVQLMRDMIFPFLRPEVSKAD